VETRGGTGSGAREAAVCAGLLFEGTGPHGHGQCLGVVHAGGGRVARCPVRLAEPVVRPRLAVAVALPAEQVESLLVAAERVGGPAEEGLRPADAVDRPRLPLAVPEQTEQVGRLEVQVDGRRQAPLGRGDVTEPDHRPRLTEAVPGAAVQLDRLPQVVPADVDVTAPGLAGAQPGHQVRPQRHVPRLVAFRQRPGAEAGGDLVAARVFLDHADVA
jgi:hypothetical protein